MLRHALRVLALLLLVLPKSWAAGTVALVLSDNSAPFREFSNTFTESLQSSTQWKVSSVGSIDSLSSANSASVIVTAGLEAFRQSLARAGNTPIVATLIGRPVYEKLLAESGRPRGRTTAIFIEQPLNRQIAFLRQLLPGNTRVGMLLSEEGRNTLTPIRHALSAAGFALDTENIDSDETLLSAVNALLPRVQLLLTTPDPKIYKRDNIKTILVTSYRHQKPVIAFSSTFVTAGALAAIYSNPPQIARQAADLIIEHGTSLPAPVYPNQFSIAINRNVAEALNLEIADEPAIRRALLAGKEFR